MDLVLFGIQGSGKGTQARKLAADFGYEIFETGGELRKIAATDTELGRTVASYINEGNLAPLEVVMEVVKRAILARPAKQRLLFDGIPRNLDQMHGFDAVMTEAGRAFRCLHLLLSPEDALARIRERAKIEGRTDDANEEYVRRRMQIFTEQTLPVIEAYASRGLVTDVDGHGSIDEVYARMKKAVEGMAVARKG